MTDQTQDPAAVAPAAPAAPAEPATSDRARALVDGYIHAMTTASPRNKVELDELKALLGVA